MLKQNYKYMYINRQIINSKQTKYNNFIYKETKEYVLNTSIRIMFIQIRI